MNDKIFISVEVDSPCFKCSYLVSEVGCIASRCPLISSDEEVNK